MRSHLLLLCLLFCASLSHAAQRTFVSAASGSDANDCSRSSPCRQFTRAIQQTDTGGEVVVLDSGGYGTVTIPKSVSIVAPAGVYAGITVFAGSGVTIDSTLNSAVITLRGLSLTGLGGSDGISHAGGTASTNFLYVDRCAISGFTTTGIDLTRGVTFQITDCVIREVGNYGVSTSGGSRGLIRNVVLARAAQGILVRHGNVAIQDSSASAIATAGFFVAAIPTQTAVLTCERCHSTGNGIGFWASGEATGDTRMFIANSVASMNTNFGVSVNPNSTGRVGHTAATHNSVGFYQSGGLFESMGDNNVRGNTVSETSGTITIYDPQ